MFRPSPLYCSSKRLGLYYNNRDMKTWHLCSHLSICLCAAYLTIFVCQCLHIACPFFIMKNSKQTLKNGLYHGFFHNKALKKTAICGFLYKFAS